MTRQLLAAAMGLIVLAAPADAKRIARAFGPVEKVARAEIVLAGKVTAIEKEMVDAVRFPGDTQKVPHKVAVIKIDKPLIGGGAVTHVKVGFIPPPPIDPTTPRPPIRGGFQPVELKEGQEGVFFLTRHAGGEFYTFSPMMGPIDSKAENYKTQFEQVQKAAAALADPMKALKADKPADRFFSAAALVARYRSYPESGGEVETLKVAAEESQLILKAIAEADWKKSDENGLGALQSFYQLGLNPSSGFQQPQPKPGVDFEETLRAAFVAWLADGGKDYRIEKLVPKKK
jgi:hypothetical protein